MFTVSSLSASRSFYPQLVGMVPSLGAVGVWFIADARALSSGRRRHQKIILGAISVTALAGGLLASYVLHGGL